MKCKIICALFIFIVIGIIAFSAFSCSCTKEYSGEEWLERQHYFFDDLAAFGEEMDTVYTLYFTGKISDDDFISEVNTLNDLYSILQLKRQKEKEEFPVAPESHTFLSTECTKSLDKILDTYGKILRSTFDKNGLPIDVKNLSYDYMKYKRDIMDGIAGYETAILLNKEEANEGSKISNSSSKKTNSNNSSSKSSEDR